jgi:hypothetical protein
MLTSISQAEDPIGIRSARESDVEAIIEIETGAFPQVYTNASELANRRRCEIDEGYPCYRILVSRSAVDGQTEIHGVVLLESYLRSANEFHHPGTGERIALSANRPPDRKPAYDILMAATRADPALLNEEFLCEFSPELAMHVTDYSQLSPRSVSMPTSGKEATARDSCATLWIWLMNSL